ncbi:MAG TPA: tRNA (adenosine(37)-N6)-threonylcarbamoyltransferase complex dimerization subunit type 1 TsaB [bacterium]|nr:tRNA (adenosine(37)-N6)-threonylcarbamoyltransferase complex dimerization subunit type 1 TsaB [bacterium]HPP11785.1 tRNA (adenosine(37)-N6)-threonylcarbamoyltransferase complex dimerization subunit type 1 TsaB [bacterium]
MTVLVIETSTRRPSLALAWNSEVRDELIWETEDLAINLLGKLETLLERNHIDITTVSRIAICLGPGSWTGVRVGLSFAKGLVCGQRQRLYGFFSVESLMFACRKETGPVCCLVNAYRGRFYYYLRKKPAVLVRSPSIKTGTIREILSFLPPGTLLTGPGLEDIPESMVKEYRDLRVAERPRWYPLAGEAARLLFHKTGRKLPSPPLEPFYGR